MAAVHEYEVGLSRALLEVLEESPGVKVYGLNDLNRLAGRVPTYAFTLEGMAPRQVAQELGKRNIQVWDGHYYAISVTESLGLEGQGGMVRVGPVHYNTPDEIERLIEVLDPVL